jgi:succinate dehydrogenase hydrophobic anchor subunit
MDILLALTIASAAVFYISARAIYMSLRSDMLNTKQKVLITIICLLLPILAPLAVHYILKDELNSRENDTNNVFDYLFLCSALTHWSNGPTSNSEGTYNGSGGDLGDSDT